MAWQMTGKMIEACSCRSVCPCALGPATPDQEWCSGALTFAIDRGQANGVDLSGRTVVFLIDLPKDFASGDGTARLYIDDAAEEKQRQELEAIFTGQKGGPGEVLAGLVSKWLPAASAPIKVGGGDNPTVSVNGVGNSQLNMIRDGAGNTAEVVNAPVLGLIDIGKEELARADGSRFADPEMRAWDSWGHGGVCPFNWSV